MSSTHLNGQATAAAPSGDHELVWYVCLAPDDVRAVSLEQLDAAFRQGLVDNSTRIWQHGMADWEELGVVVSRALAEKQAESEVVNRERERRDVPAAGQEALSAEPENAAEFDDEPLTVAYNPPIQSGAVAYPPEAPKVGVRSYGACTNGKETEQAEAERRELEHPENSQVYPSERPGRAAQSAGSRLPFRPRQAYAEQVPTPQTPSSLRPVTANSGPVALLPGPREQHAPRGAMGGHAGFPQAAPSHGAGTPRAAQSQFPQIQAFPEISPQGKQFSSPRAPFGAQIGPDLKLPPELRPRSTRGMLRFAGVAVGLAGLLVAAVLWTNASTPPEPLNTRTTLKAAIPARPPEPLTAPAVEAPKTGSDTTSTGIGSTPPQLDGEPNPISGREEATQDKHSKRARREAIRDRAKDSESSTGSLRNPYQNLPNEAGNENKPEPRPSQAGRDESPKDESETRSNNADTGDGAGETSQEKRKTPSSRPEGMTDEAWLQDSIRKEVMKGGKGRESSKPDQDNASGESGKQKTQKPKETQDDYDPLNPDL